MSYIYASRSAGSAPQRISSANVTNYYRGGDTTNTQIIDSYNRTFNTIHNTTNNTNNYEANIKLSDFLNQYTTNNVTNQYTYSADFKLELFRPSFSS